jgi:hypothetical protein
MAASGPFMLEAQLLKLLQPQAALPRNLQASTLHLPLQYPQYLGRALVVVVSKDSWLSTHTLRQLLHQWLLHQYVTRVPSSFLYHQMMVLGET